MQNQWDLCCHARGGVQCKIYLLAWSYDALTSFDNKHICWLHAWGREIPKGHLCFLHPPTPSHPPLPRGRTFLSSQQKVKARLLNIVLAKNTRVKMSHQCFFLHHFTMMENNRFCGRFTCGSIPCVRIWQGQRSRRMRRRSLDTESRIEDGSSSRGYPRVEGLGEG